VIRYEVIERLYQARTGLTLEEAYTPSVWSIETARGLILVTHGHNVEGWEAALDTGGTQHGLPDGPAADAEPAVVVAWLLTLPTAEVE
jgi:hypothetical protein